MIARLSIACTVLFCTSTLIAQDVYRLDSRNTEIGFVGTKKDGKHEGGFKEVKGTVTVKDNDVLTAQFKVEIDLRSIFTDNPQLTAHLKGPDFFNVQKNPTARFVSTKVEKNGSKFDVHGKLTMNGVTKELVIPASIDITGPGLSMESSNWEINRHDWRISYGAKQIDEKVKMTLKVMAPK